MTRETKVGIAVACSFLSLVAAVVVLRMRHGDEPDPTTTGSGLVAQGKNGATPGKEGPGSVVRPNAGQSAPAREPGVLPAVFNSPGDSLPVADPPGVPGGNHGLAVPAAPASAVKDNLPGLPPAPGVGLPEVAPPPIPAPRLPEPPPSPVVAPPNIPAPSAPPAVPVPGGTTGAVPGVPAPAASAELNKMPGFPGAEPTPPPARSKEPVTPPAVAAAPADSGLPGLPPPPASGAGLPAPSAAVTKKKQLSPEEEQQKQLKELMNQVAASGQGDGPPAPAPRPATTVPVPAPVSGPEKGPPAPGSDLLAPPPTAGLPPPTVGLPPPPAPAPLAGSDGPPKVDPPAGSPLVPPAPAAVLAKDQVPGVPAAVKAPDGALNGQRAPTDPPGAGTGRLPGSARPGDAPAAVAMGPITADDAPPGSRSPQAPAAPTPGLPTPFPPARAPEIALPPLGAPPGGSSAPIAVPMPPPQAAGSGPAKLQSFDVETHRVQPGDSTFTDLSKKLYGSDKYAQALLQFNREYPLAGDNLKADPPRLEPGQPIYFPPTHILEQPRYAAAPPPARPIASTPSPVPVGVPPPTAVAPPRQPVAPAVPVVGTTTSLPPAAASAAGTRSYTVQGNGEMLFEIARQTLGDGRRWSEIYRLNPDIRPELAIPGGTQLRLPADARVGS